MLIIFCLCSGLNKADIVNSKKGFLDFNLYPYLSDMDTDSSATINTAATLSHGFSYFSLTNFGNQNSMSELEEIETFYTEQNIRWRVIDHTFNQDLPAAVPNNPLVSETQLGIH